MPDASDMELLRDYDRQGSEEAFAELVRRHVNLVYSAALRHAGIAAHAEEITQAVFVILARQAGRLRPDTILESWLHETTRLTSLRFVRGERRRQFREQEAYMQSTLQDTTDLSTWNQLAPLLDEAISRLGKQDRDAVMLRFFKDKSLREVAAGLKVNEAAAQKRVLRAVEKLRRFFSRRGIVVPAAVLTASICAHSVQAAPAALARSVTALAAAKGAAASGSTLTLIQGALKIMAWTKAKTIVAVGIGAIALSLGVGYVGFFSRTAPRQAGRLKLPTGQVTPMIGFPRYYGIVLASDGSLWAWGDEDLGWPVLGLNGINHTVSLRQIGNDTDWVSLAVGGSHNLAVKSDGTLWAWGQNLRFQLGDGRNTTRTTPVPSVPGNDWKQAAAGVAHSLALKKDGTLWAWGLNNAGQLGIGSMESSSTARQVGLATNWIKIQAHGLVSAGLQSDGSLWIWGSVLSGLSGNDDLLLVPTRVRGEISWVDMCFGGDRVFAIKSDGTLWGWGRNADIYTGAGDKSSNSIPTRIGTNSDWSGCAAGTFYQTLLKKDGSLWALDASADVDLKADFIPAKLKRIALDKHIAAFAAGLEGNGVALTDDGEVWTWGKVVGEHTATNYLTRGGGYREPKFTIWSEPRQLSNIDPKDGSTKN